MSPREAEAVRPTAVRRTNLAVVLDHLRRHGPSSRSVLVNATGLTRSSIGGLVAQLGELGLAEEEEPLSDGSPGRPSPVVRVDRFRFGVLAVEIGVDELAVALIGLDGAVVRVRRAELSRERTRLGEVLADVAALADQLGCCQDVIDGRRVLAVGVAVPGLVRSADHTIALVPRFHWRDVDLGPMLREALGLSVPVFVGNDADLGGLAEATFGSGVGAEHLVFVSGEVGVGGSAIVRGSRLVGRSGFAGEFGHLPVNPSGERCWCGAIGCWETEVGERALLRRAGLDVDGGVREVDRLLELAAASDPTVLSALVDEGRWLGIGIAGLVNIFDPDVVALGALFFRILPFVREALDEALSARLTDGLDRLVPVVGAALGAEATLTGAAELAFEPFVADPVAVSGA